MENWDMYNIVVLHAICYRMHLRIEIRKENKNKSNSMLFHPPKRSDLIPHALLSLSCPFLPSIPVTLSHPETTTVADVSQGRGPTTLRPRFSIRQHGRSNVL